MALKGPWSVTECADGPLFQSTTPSSPPPRASQGCGPLQDKYLDLVLRVVDHQRVGQGVLRERGEVGLGQQGLQSSEHLLLVGQALGVRE